MSHQRRRIVIDSDDDDEDISGQHATILKTPATKNSIDPFISANSHTIERATSPQREHITITVRNSDESSGDEMKCNGQQIIDIMHGEDSPIQRRRSRHNGSGSASGSVAKGSSSRRVSGSMEGVIVHNIVDSDDTTSDHEKYNHRPATPQFTTSAAHAALTSNSPPALQISSSRRSSRLSKGPGQDKLALRKKLKDLRELRSKGKSSIGGLYDSSSGSEDEEIRAMAAKHQRDQRKYVASRLEQQKDSSEGESDDSNENQYGNDEEDYAASSGPDLDDMSTFIVDDDEVEEELEEAARRAKKHSKSRPKRPIRDMQHQRCKRRVHCDSDSDDEGNGAAVNQLKRHRQAPTLQVVSERKRKRRVLINDDDDESDDGEDKDSMTNNDSFGETEVSEDSSAIDHRRQRKKGKVQMYTPSGSPSADVSPLVTISDAKRGFGRKRGGQSKMKVKSKSRSSSYRKIIRDEDDDSSVYEASSESAENEESDSEGDDDEGYSDEAVVDGFSLYRQVDLLRQEQEDGGIDSSPGNMFRKSLCTSEAIGVYIEMLLCLLTDPDYRQKYDQCTDGALHIGMSVSRSEKERIQSHCSAARTVENLICTSRESLLGSSVWKGEFFHELRSRPFFDITYSRTHEPRGNKADDRGKVRGLERCDACGRESKCVGGYKIHFFGPTYDAPGLWSSRRWIEKLPSMIFNSMTPYVSATPAKKSANTTPGGHSSSSFGEYSTVSSTFRTPGSRQQAVAAANFKSDVKRMLRLRENLQEQPYDDEEDEEEEDDEEDASGGSMSVSSPSVALSSALLKRVCISGNGSPKKKNGWASDSEDENTVEAEAALPWWQRKWGRDLDSDPETKWVVNAGCKRRTQLYHTLLHYKFRLILKIRERVRRKALSNGPLSPVTLSKGSKGGQGVETGASVMDALGGGFVAAEVERFQELLVVAGQQYGGEEHAKISIWSDDEGGSPSKRSGRVSLSSGGKQRSLSGKSSVGNSGQRRRASSGNGRGGHRGPTLDGWLRVTPASSSSGLWSGNK
mmetsp:Transcript_6062/g.9882  ORF Transcript_6062/g.9882 Transcript_6062/m.9882 type:complete len:1024 (-) Transcript_6062:2034-5105(-)